MNLQKSTFLRGLLKTVVVTAAGLIGPGALTALDHPSGGMATAISHSPGYLAAWTITGYFAHNLWDHYFGTAATGADAPPPPLGDSPKPITSQSTGVK